MAAGISAEATAATLHKSGQTHITSAADAAEATGRNAAIGTSRAALLLTMPVISDSVPQTTRASSLFGDL